MRKTVLALSVVVLMSFLIWPSNALPASTVDNGMIFGGQWSAAENLTASVTQQLSDLPAVVEVFTATWCENCVEVEHALDEVQHEGLLIQYHMHRAIGESQDPFGSEHLDQRWRDRYGPSSPPAVVFNGSLKKIGSVADDGTLENEFTNLAQTDLGLGAGTSTFAWTPNGDGSGILLWNLEMNASHLENMTLSVNAYIVEVAAEFEEGSNGLGTYPHIVHDIVVLGNQTQGSAQIALPTAFDGDDLQVHLVYQLTVNQTEVVDDTTEPVEDEDAPAPSMMVTLLASFSAGLFNHVRSKDSGN